MWKLGKNEILEVDPELQQVLTDTFGINDFGDPYYRIAWGMKPNRRVSKPGGGYEDGCPNRPAWLLQRWMSPHKWGSPKLFRYINSDPANGQLLFPYPEFGEYETLKELGDKPIDWEVLHSTMPFLEAISRLTDAQMRAAKDRQKELDEKADVEMITDRLMDALPTRYGPTSYSRGGCRTSVLDRKMAEIQQVWNQFSRAQMAEMKKGLQQKAPTG